MHIGYLGLGKMGLGQVARLLEKGHRVVAWNRSEKPREEARKLGAETPDTIEGVCRALKSPRCIWVMVPDAVVDTVLEELVSHLRKGDTVIDGGNSFFEDSMGRAKRLAKKGINFLDVGTSGGPSGARKGACLMIGGEKRVFKKYRSLFKDLASDRIYSNVPQNNGIDSGAFAYVGKSGAGHFVKMVHNGIEYGMMQAIGEGFDLLRTADLRGLRTNKRGKKITFGLDLTEIARLYNRGSVIESRLVGWLANAFEEHGEKLSGISGEVAHSGEGQWTVTTAEKLGVPVEVIRKAFEFRVKSKGNPSYTGQVVSALRNQFGGHRVRRE